MAWQTSHHETLAKMRTDQFTSCKYQYFAGGYHHVSSSKVTLYVSCSILYTYSQPIEGHCMFLVVYCIRILNRLKDTVCFL